MPWSTKHTCYKITKYNFVFNNFWIYSYSNYVLIIEYSNSIIRTFIFQFDFEVVKILTMFFYEHSLGDNLHADGLNY